MLSVECLGWGRKRKEGARCLTSLFQVAGSRIELETSGLWIRRSNQLSYPAIMFWTKHFVKCDCKVTAFWWNEQNFTELFLRFFAICWDSVAFFRGGRNFCQFSLSCVKKMVNLHVNTRVTRGDRYWLAPLSKSCFSDSLCATFCVADCYLNL